VCVCGGGEVRECSPNYNGNATVRTTVNAKQYINHATAYQTHYNKNKIKKKSLKHTHKNLTIAYAKLNTFRLLRENNY
jgi:hypothetical protein